MKTSVLIPLPAGHFSPSLSPPRPLCLRLCTPLSLMDAQGHKDEQKSNESEMGMADNPNSRSNRKMKGVASSGTIVPPLPSTRSKKTFPRASSNLLGVQSEADLSTPVDPGFPSGDTHWSGLKEIVLDDNEFLALMQLEKMDCDLNAGGFSGVDVGNANLRDCEDKFEDNIQDDNPDNTKHDNAEETISEPIHPQSNFANSSLVFSAGGSSGETGEASQGMSAESLAELAAEDPKRAQRILANRRAAARSKERKARYIATLEQNVQELTNETTSLSARINQFQQDVSRLSYESTELMLRLQSMESQAQLSGALSIALQREVDRLKLVTGETLVPYADPRLLQNAAFNGDPRHVPNYPPLMTSSFPNLQGQPFPNMDSGGSSNVFLPQQNNLGNFQGLQIRSSTSGSSASASGSNSTA